MECTICTNDYDSVSHRPVIGSCGHTVCHQCRCQLRWLNNYACPSCQKPKSFIIASINFQFLDLQTEMNIELSSQRKEWEELEGRHQKVLEEKECLKAVVLRQEQEMTSAYQKVLEEKESLKAVVLRQKQEMVSAKELSRKALSCCCECRSVMYHLVARVCLDCSSKDDGAAGTGTNQADKMICPTCFLDGTHKGHSSQPFLSFKLAARAAVDFDPLLSSAKKNDVKMEESGWSVAGLYRRCAPLLFELRQLAVSQPSEKDYDDLVDVGRELSREYDGTAEKFNELAGLLVKKDKTIRKLADVIERRKMSK